MIGTFARCVTAAFFLSHALRKNVKVIAFFRSTEKSYAIVFDGKKLKYLGPDERSIGILTSKAQIKLKNSEKSFIYSTPGIVAYYGSLNDVFSRIMRTVGEKTKIKVFYPNLNGILFKDINYSSNSIFTFSLNSTFTVEEQKTLKNFDTQGITFAEREILVDRMVFLLNNEIDRRHDKTFAKY